MYIAEKSTPWQRISAINDERNTSVHRKLYLKDYFIKYLKKKGLRLLFSKLIYVVICKMLTLREEESKNIMSVRQVTGRFTDVSFPPNDNNNSTKLFPWKLTTTQCGLKRFFWALSTEQQDKHVQHRKLTWWTRGSRVFSTECVRISKVFGSHFILLFSTFMSPLTVVVPRLMVAEMCPQTRTVDRYHK